MTISSKKPDDAVGSGRKLDDFRQDPVQKATLGAGGEEGGKPEPKEGWGGPGAGRPPSALGGSSGGSSDRLPAGGATVSNAKATNPKTEPGETHDA